MNLPFILDVALGLIFIYLIFSLLASEIQELIATILQWRAQHLRKSIEILLAGDALDSEDSKVIQLANKIYTNPLVKGINQEAKGFLPTLPRKATWLISAMFNSLRKPTSRLKKETIFGDNKHSAPSYIPAETFATTLVDTLQLTMVVQKLTEIRLEKFKDEKLAEVKNILLSLEEKVENNEVSNEIIKDIVDTFEQLNSEYNQIVADYKNSKTDVQISLNRMGDSFDKYIDHFQYHVENNQEFLEKTWRNLKFFRKGIFDNIEQTIAVNGLKPNIHEIVQSIQQGSAVYAEMKAALQDQDSETYQKIQELIDSLPAPVVTSIATMAKRVQMTANTAEEGIQIFRREIEKSFDSSMERAGGVYKRNAKGVAILIGVTLAVSANADTFHMISRLSKDTILRAAIINKVVQVSSENPNQSGLVNIDTNRILEDITLPIGWNNNNLQEQLGANQSLGTIGKIYRILAMITGWLITGLAIAMGASFWFDILSKVMNVRNVGKQVKGVKD
ncbi:hypothetical protein B6N60_00512 [Richelia sinica FACHB-800]|uniref:Uncharacterized protein n=1 Tax=Richelia sinica FACHB-800 TaxID=1357546 RepID=A0A975T4C7_9NOST|nr:hypothetical protein [Richelia sinica]MBD2662985.1 hypothetical protein [Richelia sinica FACHB-800]QXE21834.1 hypothetical protein B6N60_00512 [Richelia sinica FACHB-800]